MAGEPPQRRRDVVALAVMTNRMEGVVRKMTNTLFRTARSTLLNTARDFSCCIVTANHELLVMAESLPIHVMSGPDLMSRWLAQYHPNPRRGDAFLHNSPTFRSNTAACAGGSPVRRTLGRFTVGESTFVPAASNPSF